jgi:GT2 family glycosyltransferase
MNPVLILTRNNLALTKRCVESVRKQDVPVELYVVDNGSTDGTEEWLGERMRGFYTKLGINLGVSWAWNHGLGYLLSPIMLASRTHCLVIGNDTVLPPWFYRELLSYDVPFVTGIAVDSMDAIQTPAPRMPLCPSPDFSAFLIRKDCWDKVGPFDERMKLYASDCDYHVRAHRLGVPLWKANVPFYHERSSTLRLAPPGEKAQIQEQANKDREMFRSLYGCLPGTKEYEALFNA